jgi:hypothetical protein
VPFGKFREKFRKKENSGYFACIAALLTSSGEYLLLLVTGTILWSVLEFRDVLP